MEFVSSLESTQKYRGIIRPRLIWLSDVFRVAWISFVKSCIFVRVFTLLGTTVETFGVVL